MRYVRTMAAVSEECFGPAVHHTASRPIALADAAARAKADFCATVTVFHAGAGRYGLLTTTMA